MTNRSLKASEKLLAVLSTMPQGATCDELGPMLGMKRWRNGGSDNLSSLCSDCTRRGLLVWVHEPLGKANLRRRYFAIQFAPAVHGEASKRLPPPKKAKPVRQYTKLDADAPVICNVKPIICPAGKDHRFTVEKTKVTPYFSAMAIGSYPPSDSVIARIHPGA
jgi:hypothetical protein